MRYESSKSSELRTSSLRSLGKTFVFDDLTDQDVNLAGKQMIPDGLIYPILFFLLNFIEA